MISLEELKIKLLEYESINSDVVDEVMNELIDNRKLTLNKPFIDLSKDKIIELQNEFSKTLKTDFRKRAQIMARIISAGMDE